MIRRFWPEIRSYRLLILGAFTALLAETLLRILEPWPLKFVFDSLMTESSAGVDLGFIQLGTIDPTKLILFAAIAVVCFAGFRAVAAYANTVGFALAGNRIMTKIRNDLYNHVQCLPLTFHNKSRGGDLIIRVISDVALLQEIMVTAALPLIGNLLVLAGMLAVMLWFNWQLAMIAVTIVPLFWLFTVRFGRRISDVSRKQRKRESAMAATVAESLGSIKTVQALSLENAFSKTFTSASSKSLKEGVQAKRLAAALERSVDMLIAAATALVLWYGANLVMKKALTPGDLIVFLAYLKNAFKPMRNFAKYSGRLAKASAAGERVMELIELSPDVKDAPDAVAAEPFRGSIRFENVTFGYEPEKLVLDKLDFEVQPGESIAIVGQSGAGKSTLVSLILRLYDPGSGRILVDGSDIRGYTLESLRSQINIVLQDSLLFAASVRDNIAYGNPAASVDEIKSAAILANAHGFISAFPDGYDTVIGERGVTLSNGQRQRLAIARAAIRKCPILILDEPTTGLDAETESEVVKALDNVSKGKTTFIISHTLSMASRADRILCLANGRIIESGTHTELMNAGGLYADLYRIQTGTVTNMNKVSRLMLEASDAELAQRDYKLPGLATLLDPHAFLTSLKDALPDREFGAIEAKYLRYKPGTNCLAAYNVFIDGDKTVVYAKAYGGDAKVKLGKAQKRSETLRVSFPRNIALEKSKITVCFFPNDNKLKSLWKLFDQEKRLEFLPSIFPDQPDYWNSELSSLRYKPERRYVARMSVGGKNIGALKAYTEKGYSDSDAGSKNNIKTERFRIARQTGCSGKYYVRVFEWLNGCPLGDVLLDGGHSATLLKAVGKAAAELHLNSVGDAGILTKEMESKRIAEVANGMASLYPAAGKRFLDCSGKISRQLLARNYRSAFIHGDFYADQILVDGNILGLLDLDRACYGDPAGDLGLFVAHLEREVLRNNLTPETLRRFKEAFCAGYLSVGESSVLEDVDLFTAAGLFRLLPEPFRYRENNWRQITENQLDRIEELMKKCEQPNGSLKKANSDIATGSTRKKIIDVVDKFDVTNDAAMPFMKMALDTQIVQERLAECLPTSNHKEGNYSLKHIKVIRYKPGRRCLVEYHVDDSNNETSAKESIIIGKARAKGLDRRTYELQMQLWNNGFGVNSVDNIAVPEPVGIIPAFNMWFQRKVAGVAATKLLAEPDGITIAQRIAETAHKLHSSGIKPSRRHSISDELGILKDRLKRVIEMFPRWKKRINRVLDECVRIGNSIKAAKSCGIHRDFYPDQLIVDGGKIFLTDLDLYCAGDPALDIGNFLGHLVEMGIRTKNDDNAFLDIQNAISEEFLRLSGFNLTKNIETYTTLTIARHIYISTLFDDRRNHTEVIIDTCEKRLDVLTTA
ncbi:MAG: hypothetical protein IEMM0002_0119 [bacterium]|nr:MAG: hypothetical protein IEMM0002_0119 [bacterium]